MEKTFLPGNLRDRLTELMEDRKISQKKFADAIGLNQGALNRFMNGQTESLGNEPLIRAAHLFNVSTDFLLGLTDTPDRKQYCIEELGLSAQAARNLYIGRTDKRVVTLLLESPDFAMATHQIANFLSGSLSAGFAAQNELMDRLADMVTGPKMQEAKQKVRSFKVPVYQQELSGIQNNFMKAVKSMKTDMDQEVQSRAMTEEQFQQMLKLTVRDAEGKPVGITPKAFSEAFASIASIADMLRPETLKLIEQTAYAVGTDLQEDYKKHHVQQ